MVTYKETMKKAGLGLVAGASMLGLAGKPALAQEPVRPDYRPLASVEYSMRADEIPTPKNDGVQRNLGDIVNKDFSPIIQSRHKNNSHKSSWKSLGMKLLGALAGLAIHEGSHSLAGYAVGADNALYNPLKDPFGVPVDMHGRSKDQKILFYGAGVVGQTIATEVALRHGINNDFAKGLALFGTVDNLRYAIAPGARGKNNDISNLKHAGANPALVRSVLGAVGSYQTWRIMKESEELQNNTDIFIRPNPEGGFTAGFTYKF